MPDINPSIPIAGQPNSSEEPKIVTALTQLVAAVNNADDDQLASPNNAVWRTYRQQLFGLQGAMAAGTYFFSNWGNPVANGGNANAGLGSQVPGASVIRIPSLTDFTVAGKTAQGRLVVHLLTNATAPGVALGFGLYPIGSLGGATSIIMNITLGAGIAGSFATITPAASTPEQVAGAAFTLPSGSSYLLGVQWAASALAANTVVSGVVELQVRFA